LTCLTSIWILYNVFYIINGFTYNNASLINATSLEKHLKKLGLVAFVLKYQKKYLQSSKPYRDGVAYSLGDEVARWSGATTIPSMLQFEERAMLQKNKRKISYEDVGIKKVFSKKKCGKGTSYEVMFPGSYKKRMDC